MDELFPAMMQSLTTAVNTISHPYYRVPEQTAEQLADTLQDLRSALIQLNGVLFFDFPFEDGSPYDIYGYTRLLQEYETPCAEKIGFMLDKPPLFDNDSFTRHEKEYLSILLEDITSLSLDISRLAQNA